MRVDAQVIGTLTLAKANIAAAIPCTVPSDATVQHGVRSVATPLTVLNYVIALVRAR